MDAVYDLEFFRNELNLINDPEVRKLTEEALRSAPVYIWHIPASMTGKYHPPDDNVPGGLCWHLKKTAWLGYRMFDNLMLDTDIGVVAGLTHDIAHRGLEDTPDDDYESYQKHGELAAYRLGQSLLNISEEEDYNAQGSYGLTWALIGGCVASHMGRWGNCKPKTIEQVTFHLADVAASTRGLVSIGFGNNHQIGHEGYSIEEIVGKKLYFKEVDGELCFNFGKKHMGTPLKTVVKIDYGYTSWMLKQGVMTEDNPKGFPKEVIDIVQDARIPDYLRKKDDHVLDLFDNFSEKKGQI